MAEAKKAAKNDDEKAPAKGPELKAVENTGGEEGADAAPAGRGLPVRKIVLIVLPLLIIAGAVVGAYMLGYIGHKEAKVDCTTVTQGDKDYAACAEQMAKAGAPPPPGIFVEVPEMIVNMNTTGKLPRYLKVGLAIELESKDDQKNFEAIMPRVVDQFQTYLRELRLDDLRGSSGLYRMKIELLSRVRAAAPDIKIRDVLFKEMLVQ